MSQVCMMNLPEDTAFMHVDEPSICGRSRAYGMRVPL